MLKKFADDVDEIAHLATGTNATLDQINRDLIMLAERMRIAAQQKQADDACTCAYPRTARGQFYIYTCVNCGKQIATNR